MKNYNIEEFKKNSNIEMVKQFMNANNGYITSKQITDLGIHRMYLKIMVEKNIIEKVFRGIYVTKNVLEDELYVFQLKYPKTIFSGFTALYFWGLTEIFPTSYDITVGYNYHVSYINKFHNVTRCKDELINLGLVEVKTSFGNYVYAYDAERCICDIIKNRNKLDYEQVKKSIKMYLTSKNRNLEKLIEYSKKMKIYNKVFNYIEVYYE